MVLLSSIMLKITSSSLSIRYINNHKQIFLLLFIILHLFGLTTNWVFCSRCSVNATWILFFYTFWKGDFFCVVCLVLRHRMIIIVIEFNMEVSDGHWSRKFNTKLNNIHHATHITLYKGITKRWNWMNLKNK